MGGGRPGGRMAVIAALASLVVVSLADPSSAQPGPIALSPTRGPVGASVTIGGTRLSTATGVSFGTLAARFVVDSDEQLSATVPPGAVTGPVTV